MCGIAGEFCHAAGGAVDLRAALPMISALAHRGPDEWGYYLDDRRKLVLFHTRLSIIDLAAGRQPLSNEDGSVWVSFGGELYGHESLAAGLRERGHQFRTRTDTEIIVHLYEEYGEGFVERLRGEFAIALFDRRKDTLYLIRDRFGIKPLYYYRAAGSLIFASEIKSLFSHPAVSREFDPAGLLGFLAGTSPPTASVFRGVRQIEPGCFVAVRGSELRKVRYWQLRFASLEQERQLLAARGEESLVEDFLALLEEAVSVRLRADVEVGVYLSGGIDSISIGALMARLGGRPLRAFTVGFEDRLFDESAAARALAEHCQLDHQLLRIGDGDLADHFVESLWHCEIPVWNTHGTAKFLLSRLAGEQVKVVLTGEGADELLAGYSGFRQQLLLETFLRELARRPHHEELRRRFQDFLERPGVRGEIARFESFPQVPRTFACHPFPVLRALLRRDALAAVLSEEMRVQLPDPVAELATRAAPVGGPEISPIAVSQHLLYRTLLPAYLLNCLGDRQEMAHSVEGRVPFLDHRLVELGCTLPLELKIRRGVEKYVLRQALRDLLPDELRNRRKHPFIAPTLSTLGLERQGSRFEEQLSPERTRQVGVFDGLALWELRRRALGNDSEAAREAAPILVLALSLHLLEELFVRDFPSARDRFARPALDYDLTAHSMTDPLPAHNTVPAADVAPGA